MWKKVTHKKSLSIMTRFPLKEKDRLSKWLHSVKRKGFTPTKYSKLCSEHFRESDYLYQLGFRYKQLRPDAVPSVFVKLPGHLQKKPCHERTTKPSRATVSTNGSLVLLKLTLNLNSILYDAGSQVLESHVASVTTHQPDRVEPIPINIVVFWIPWN